MKKAIAPTLEEVKEYFKNAEWVECMFDKKPYNITEGEIVCDNLNRYEALFMDNSYCRLQKNGEYAKILTYKKSCGIETEPEYMITKSEILQAVKNHPFRGATKQVLQELFPDAFKEDKVEFKRGTWYINKHTVNTNFTIINLQHFDDNEKSGYGLHMGLWGAWGMLNYEDFREATPEEVTEALTKEAVKRYKVGDYVRSCNSGDVYEIKYNNFEMGNDTWFNFNGICIFKDGQWAEIIPTISKEDAEKELGKKILN